MTPDTSDTKNDGAKPQTKVYIVRFRLPVGIRVKRRQRRSRYSELLTYQFEEKLRQKVAKLRSHYRYLLGRYSISFYGLPLVREEDLEVLEKWAHTADEEFQKLHESLHVQAVPIPIDLSAGRKGVVYQAVHDAVATHVYGKVFDRLQKLSKKGKDLPENSRRALLDLTKNLRAWNLLGSKDIEDRLAQMARQFANKATAPAEEMLEAEMKKLATEGAWIEL
jgi:hypothetical protein